MGKSTEPPRTAQRRHPLSAKNQTQLLRSLQERADAGDVAAAESIIRLGMLAKASAAT
jgi:hypothetical protein